MMDFDVHTAIITVLCSTLPSSTFYIYTAPVRQRGPVTSVLYF